MNQHSLPPSNVRPVEWQAEDFRARPAGTEQFIIVRGTRKAREPYLDDTMMSRAEVIEAASDDVEYLRQIIAFDLTHGTARDATEEITSVFIQRWAEDGKLLTEKQKEFVAMCKGEAFANAFRVEAA